MRSITVGSIAMLAGFAGGALSRMVYVPVSEAAQTLAVDSLTAKHIEIMSDPTKPNVPGILVHANSTWPGILIQAEDTNVAPRMLVVRSATGAFMEIVSVAGVNDPGDVTMHFAVNQDTPLVVFNRGGIAFTGSVALPNSPSTPYTAALNPIHGLQLTSGDVLHELSIARIEATGMSVSYSKPGYNKAATLAPSGVHVSP